MVKTLMFQAIDHCISKVFKEATINDHSLKHMVRNFSAMATNTLESLKRDNFTDTES